MLSMAKIIPFLVACIFLLLFGLMLVMIGLLMEYHWEYEMGLEYKPFWSGGLVVWSAILVSFVCCFRSAPAALTVTTLCLPALTAVIFQLILSGLLAESIFPDENRYLCTSSQAGEKMVRCSCESRISFEVQSKGEASSAGVSDSCEDELEFVFELMVTTACACAMLIFILFYYIFWVFCAATRLTFTECRLAYSNAGSGTLPRSITHTLEHALTDEQHALVYSNNVSRRGTLSRAPSALTIPTTTLDRNQSYRPVVTVQRSQAHAQPPSRSATLRSAVRAAEYSHNTLMSLSALEDQHTYNNVPRDPVREAASQRFQIPDDIAGIPHARNRPKSISQVPITMSRRDSPGNVDSDSSEDNTIEGVPARFHASPKQLNRGKVQNNMTDDVRNGEWDGHIPSKNDRIVQGYAT